MHQTIDLTVGFSPRHMPLATALTLSGLFLMSLLTGGCASSSSKDQQDSSQPSQDSQTSAHDSSSPDRSSPDLSSPQDGAPRPESNHFWDAATDRAPAADLVPAGDHTAAPDGTTPQDSQPSPDLPQGPNPGPVQCRNDGECGGIMTCNMSAPGGICSGCGLCPGWLECYSGFCVRDCYHDGECNAGFRCSSTDRCVLRACDATTPCPAPYACGTNGYCARPTCPAGSCPPPLICTDGLCIEP